MANFKISSTLLCVLLIGQQALAVLNKSPVQTTSNKDASEKKDEIMAEDRIISDVYGAPPQQLTNDYGPPHVGAGGAFGGPAPIYGPPEITGNHGPVQVYPPPPPELPPPPPPNSHGPSRKPKPHYGPPLPNFGPKPNFGPPKFNFGPGPGSFGPPRPQYGPPVKFSGPPNQQFGPPRFGPAGHKNAGHGPPIPISLENYGPPNRGPIVPFGPAHNEYGPPQSQILPPQGQQQHASQTADDLYGPPPPPPPPGVPAPPTPPDIKYDGWQPIAGLVGTPNNHGTPENSYGPPANNGGNQISHGSSLETSNIHSSGGHSSSLIIENGKNNVPSDSYGEPIHNQDAKHLQNSVHQSTNSHGLPPPPLPESEPFHNNQGPAKSIPAHQEHHQHIESHQNHQFGNSDNLNIHYEHHTIGDDLKIPNFEILPEPVVLNGNLHGISNNEAFGGSSSSSFGNSAGDLFHSDVATSLALPILPHETYGSPTSVNVHQQDSQIIHGNIGDLTVQQLPLHGASTSYKGSFNANSFGGQVNGHGNSGHSSGPSTPVDSYGAPPSSSFGSGGPYPASQAPRGGSWPSAFNMFGSSTFGKHHNNGNHHYHHNHHHSHRNHGPPPPPPPPRFGPPPAIIGAMIPPRNRAPMKFREQVPSGLLANINRYLPPVPKPTIHYGAPLEQQLPRVNEPHSFKSSAGSFGGSFGTDNSLVRENSFSSNSPLAAPNVHYGTPLSFNDFNTPAPVLTYGAPNFGPANSFVSTSFGGSGAAGNLYNNMVGNGLAMTYGTPVHDGHDCGFQKSTGPISGEYTSFVEDQGNRASLGGGGGAGQQPIFTNSLQSSSSGHNEHSNQQNNHQQHQNSALVNNVGPLNAGQSNNIHQEFTNFPAPSIHELDLESHEQQSGEPKDSYGNPIVGLSIENIDQAGAAALTTNDIRANSISSSYSGHDEIGQHSHEQRQNSYAPGPTFTNAGTGGLSVEALTADLTAQGYGQAKNYANNEISQEASNHYSNFNDGGNDALALALRAEGADGFQIQGSKGTYTLQIQSADGGLGTENSDGSIRHDQVLSNGLLQDILAAIEQPNDGQVQIQGSPQPQRLQEVYDDAVANSAHHQQVNIIRHQQQQQQQEQDIAGSHNEIVQQVLTVQGNEARDHENPSSDEEQIALFYDNNNNGYEESRKDIRSTSNSEGQASLRSNENSEDSQTKNGIDNNGQAEETKKSS